MRKIQISPNITVLLPDFGKHEVFVDGKGFVLERRTFPVDIDIGFLPKHIWADGTSEVVFKVKVVESGYEGVRLKASFKETSYKTTFPIFTTSSFGKIVKKDEEVFVLKVSRMPDKKPSSKIKVSFFVSGDFILKKEVWVTVSPGPPRDIVVFLDKEGILGDGKDILRVRARVIDLAGNTVFVKPSVRLTYGFVRGEELTDEGEWIFSISATSSKDITSYATFSVSEISRTLSFKVAGFIPTLWEAGADGGIATNFGRQAFFVRGQGEIRRSLGFFSVLGGGGVGFSFFPGENLQFLSVYLMPSVGIGKALGKIVFDFKAQVSPAIYRFKVDFGKEINFTLFGLLVVPELSLSFRAGRRSLISFNSLYLKHIIRPQNQFLKIKEGIDFVALTLSWSFEGVF